MLYNLILLAKRTQHRRQTHPLLMQLSAALTEKLPLFKNTPERILLIELSPTDLQTQIQAIYPNAKIKTASFFETLNADWHKAFETKSIDLMIVSNCLHWHPDIANFFGQLHDLLKSEGVLLFNTFGPDTLKELREAFAQFSNAKHIHDFIDMHHLGDALLAGGFADPVMSVERTQITYPHALALMRDLKALGQNNCHQDRIKTLGGKTLFKNILHEYPQNDEGEIIASFEVVYGHAIGQTKSNTVKLDQNAEARISIDRIGRR